MHFSSTNYTSRTSGKLRTNFIETSQKAYLILCFLCAILLSMRIGDLMNASRRIGTIDICATKHYNMNCMKINHSLGWIFKMTLAACDHIELKTLEHMNAARKNCVSVYIFMYDIVSHRNYCFFSNIEYKM